MVFEFLRKKRKSVMGILLVGFATLLMASFGVSVYDGAGRPRETAITIQDEEVSFDQVSREYGKLVRMYQEQFGANFEQLKQFVDLKQMTVDNIIRERTVGAFLETLGFSAGIPQVEEHIREIPYFGGKVDGAALEEYLAASGLTETGLEVAIRKQIMEQELLSIFQATQLPSDAEIKAIYNRENTSAKFQFAKFSPEHFLAKVESNEKELKEFFEVHKESYRIPAKVGLDYIKLDPEEYEASVPVSQDDLKLTYEDRKDEFREPAEYHLRKLVMNRPVDKKSEKNVLDAFAPKAEEKAEEKAESALSPDETKRAEVEKVLARVQAGESFEKLVRELSDDPTAKEKGGDLGWMKASALDAKLVEEVTKLTPGETTPIMDSSDAFTIYRLEEFKESRSKTFEEVLPQLEKEVRKVDAPMYLSIAAQDHNEKWRTSGKTLKEYAAEAKLKAPISSELVSATDQKLPRELVERAISLGTGGKESMEVGPSTYLFEVRDLKVSHLPELKDVSAKVEKDWKAQKALLLAKEAAAKALEAVRAGGTLPAVVAQAGATVEETKLLTRVAAKEPFLPDENTKAKAFGLSNSAPLYPEVIDRGDSFYIVQLTEKKDADPAELEKVRSALVKRQSSQSGMRLLAAFTETLRAQSNVTVNPQVLEHAEG